MPHDLAQAAEICHLLALWVRAVVTDKDAVTVEPVRSSGTPLVLRARVAPKDMGKVVGKGGRTAHSLRVLLQAAARELGENYQLDIEDVPPQEPLHRGTLAEL